MQRQWMFVASAAVLIIALGAAVGVFYSVSALNPSQVNVNRSSNTLIVTGSGEAAVEPDRVKISLGIVSEAKTAEEASAKNAEIFSVLIKRLMDAGVSKSQIETSWYNINPVYEYLQNVRPILVGYKVEHHVLVTVISEEIGQLGKKAGEIIDLAVEAGVGQVYSIQFTVSDSVVRELRNQALKNAVLEAQSKAEIMAKTLGVRLLSVNNVSEGGYQPYPPLKIGFASIEDARVATELAPGFFKVYSSVQVTYLIGL